MNKDVKSVLESFVKFTDNKRAYEPITAGDLHDWAVDALHECDDNIKRVEPKFKYGDVVVNKVSGEKRQITFVYTNCYEVNRGLPTCGTIGFDQQDKWEIAKTEEESLREQLDEALDFIVDIVEDDPSDFCLVVDENETGYCESNCNNFNKECLKKFFKYYKKDVSKI